MSLEQAVRKITAETADIWGLKNISGHSWTTIPSSGGSVVEIPNGRSVSLVPGLRVRFGASEGTIL